jgi:hypothetical protein
VALSSSRLKKPRPRAGVSVDKGRFFIVDTIQPSGQRSLGWSSAIQ